MSQNRSRPGRILTSAHTRPGPILGNLRSPPRSPLRSPLRPNSSIFSSPRPGPHAYPPASNSDDAGKPSPSLPSGKDHGSQNVGDDDLGNDRSIDEIISGEALSDETSCDVTVVDDTLSGDGSSDNTSVDAHSYDADDEGSTDDNSSDDTLVDAPSNDSDHDADDDSDDGYSLFRRMLTAPVSPTTPPPKKQDVEPVQIFYCSGNTGRKPNRKLASYPWMPRPPFKVEPANPARQRQREFNARRNQVARRRRARLERKAAQSGSDGGYDGGDEMVDQAHDKTSADALLTPVSSSSSLDVWPGTPEHHSDINNTTFDHDHGDHAAADEFDEPVTPKSSKTPSSEAYAIPPKTPSPITRLLKATEDDITAYGQITPTSCSHRAPKRKRDSDDEDDACVLSSQLGVRPSKRQRTCGSVSRPVLRPRGIQRLAERRGGHV